MAIIEPVEITKTAMDKIEEIMHSKQVPAGYGLRIGIADRGVSCGAINYTLGFDKTHEGDINYRSGKLVVVMKKLDAVHLAGLILDYVSVENEQGFTFSRSD